MRSDLKVADKSVIVIADGVENAGAIDGVVQNDLVSAAEVAVELEMGKISIAFEGALVFERAGVIGPYRAFGSSKEEGVLVVEFVDASMTTAPGGVDEIDAFVGC